MRLADTVLAMPHESKGPIHRDGPLQPFIDLIRPLLVAEEKIAIDNGIQVEVRAASLEAEESVDRRSCCWWHGALGIVEGWDDKATAWLRWIPCARSVPNLQKYVSAFTCEALDRPAA